MLLIATLENHSLLLTSLERLGEVLLTYKIHFSKIFLEGEGN